MKFPPGYGYTPANDDLNPFDLAVIFVFQAMACSAVVYGAGVIVWATVKGFMFEFG